MRKYLPILLMAFCPSLQAEDTVSEKKAASQKQEEKGRVHTDPRFKGKVMVYGDASDSFGEAPKGDDLKTRKLERLDEEDPAPKPLPPAK